MGKTNDFLFTVKTVRVIIVITIALGEYKASVALDGELLSGQLPQKQYRILIGWLAIHEEEIYAAWNEAVRGEPFDKIKPLQ